MRDSDDEVLREAIESIGRVSAIMSVDQLTEIYLRQGMAIDEAVAQVEKTFRAVIAERVDRGLFAFLRSLGGPKPSEHEIAEMIRRDQQAQAELEAKKK